MDQFESTLFLVIIFSALLVGYNIIPSSQNHDDTFSVSIIHINDFHARFEETNEAAGRCKPYEKCIGGYARAITTIKRLHNERVNPIYLNAGDNFQGTFWYTVGGWNVTSQFLNMFNADAITLGNHEFDRGIDGVVPFMKTLLSPIVIANIDDSDEPSFQGNYRKSIIIDRYSRKIGIIGVILSTVNEIANTEKLHFQDEVEVIRREATLLKDQGVEIIIVLSHCGLETDYRIAKETAQWIDVIVGGHSHSFLYTVKDGDAAPGPDKVKDVYPAVVESQDGHKVLIVQASARMKYVGDLTVHFDENGHIVSWEGAPIYLDHDIKQDPEVLSAIQPWKEIINAKGMQQVGTTEIALLKKNCEWEECHLGNFVADAFVYHYKTSLFGKYEPKDSIIGLMNSGSLRADINAGPILYSDLAATIPFGNSVDTFDLRGDHLKHAFEHAVGDKIKSGILQPKSLMQISGARVIYKLSEPFLNRVVSIEVLTKTNNSITYEPLDLAKYYRCISISFLTEGGDAFHMIPMHMKNYRKGAIDIDVIIEYFEHHNIINPSIENRIEFLD